MELFIIKRSHRFLSGWTVLRTDLERKGFLDKAKGRRKQFFFNWRIIGLQCCVRFCCTTTWISCKYTYILFLLSLPPTHPSSQPLGHHRIPGWASCSIQQLPTSYLFYIVVYIINATLSICPTFFFPCCVHKSALYVHIPIQFSSVQSLSRVWLFATPWIAAQEKEFFFFFFAKKANGCLRWLYK